MEILHQDLLLELDFPPFHPALVVIFTCLFVTVFSRSGFTVDWIGSAGDVSGTIRPEAFPSPYGEWVRYRSGKFARRCWRVSFFCSWSTSNSCLSNAALAICTDLPAAPFVAGWYGGSIEVCLIPFKYANSANSWLANCGPLSETSSSGIPSSSPL